jgi:hypothetical protein
MCESGCPSSESTFMLNKGTDLDFSFNWPDGEEGNADLTGYTVTASDVDPRLLPYLTLTLTDPSTGLITGRVEWSDELPMNGAAQFRVKISQGANDTTTNLLRVMYQ